MKEMVADTVLPPASETCASFNWTLLLSLSFFAVVWAEVINHLKSEWSINPQYSYGWSVPFLALYLIGRRWPERPSANPPMEARLCRAIVVLSALFFLPLRFVAAANPDWRLLSWLFALDAELLSLGIIYLAGGPKAVWYFAFPFLFLLVAVPWPALFEQNLTQALMRGVAAINVFFLNLIGTPAVRHGNVIEVTTGLIGIEEACSGVRSLQATLMISLFLGELYSFRIVRRLILVFLGGLLAFVCNVVRTALLVWVGAHRGPDAVHGWHDPAGLTILLVCLFGLWLISLLMLRNSVGVVMPTEAGLAGERFAFPVTLLAALTVWLLFAEGAVQLWYGLHGSALTASRWNVRWPSEERDYTNVAVAPEAQALLAYNQGGGARWKDSENRRWLLYFFQWLPGRTAARFVKTHRPDICLPASGLTMIEDQGIRLLEANGAKLPVRFYRFDNQGSPLHVFYCYWDARSTYDDTKASVEEDWTPRGRIRAALRGRREMGARMIELVVSGYESDSDAEAMLQRKLSQIVSID